MRPWHVPRFVAVACGGNGPPCREVNIVCVCVCVGRGGLGLLLVEFVQFLRKKITKKNKLGNCDGGQRTVSTVSP